MRKNRTFGIVGVSLASAAFLFVQMGMYAVHSLFGLNLKFNLIDLCFIFIKVLGIPYLKTAMSVLIWSTLAVALWLAMKTVIDTARACRRLSGVAVPGGGVGNESLPAACMLVDHPAPAAFTIGMIRPRIVVTTGLLNLLDRSELEAVIRHEQYHRRHRDPLVLCMLAVAAKAMWYIPAFKWVLATYKVAAEIMADRHAIKTMGGAAPLGSALLKMLRNGPSSDGILSGASFVSFALCSVNLRILHIMDPQMKLALKPPVLRCIVSVIGFCLITFLT